jgi:hypothetical protein
MLFTKSRLQGSSVVITLPANNGEKPEPNKGYIVVYSDDGTITLIPKLDDPFSGGAEGELYEKDDWEEWIKNNPTIKERLEWLIKLFCIHFAFCTIKSL